MSLPLSLLDQIEPLRGRECTVGELRGGLTNFNYRVATGDRAYVVRVFREPAEGGLVIDRDREYRNSVIAASTGVGAEVVAFMPQQSFMVLGFIEGTTFSDESFQADGSVARVATACRRLHDGPSFVNDFDMFELQRSYLEQVRSHGFRLPADYLDHMAAVDRIRAALGGTAERIVPCNNDLLAGNFIDDGDDIRIIDYEYSGNNDPCFELGNIWSECHLSLDQLEELVTQYYGRPRPSRVARARLQGLMSQYGWTLWASISDATSGIDFDYWSWGLEKYERAVATFRGPDLEHLLDRAGVED